MMKSSMISEVRSRAGLGFPPEKFYVRDAFSSFLIEPDDWYEMSENERRKKVTEFHKKPIADMHASNTVTCTPASFNAFSTHDGLDGNYTEIEQHQYISIKADESGLANVLPLEVVQGVWGKAVKLLKKYNSNVCSAPSANSKVKAFSVPNQSGKDRVPYYSATHDIGLM